MNFFDYDTARAIYYVYLYANITKAGEKINLSQSAMSRRVQTAEERTGIIIFNRGFHEVTPTKEGMRYVEACKEILHIGDAALKDAHAMTKEGANEVRILGTPSLATSWLPLALKGFSKKYPHIRLKIKSEVHPLDVLETDLLLSLYLIDNKHIDKTRLYDQHQGLYASKDYLQERGVPQDMHDLENHDLLALNQDVYADHASVNWLLNYGIGDAKRQRPPVMELNSNDGRYHAMLHGHGIAPVSIPYINMMKPDNVVRVLPEIISENLGMYIYYNSHCKLTENIKKVIQFLKGHVAENQQVYSIKAQQEG